MKNIRLMKLITLLLVITLVHSSLYGQNKSSTKGERAFFKNYLYTGSIQQKDFLETLHFKNFYGLIILETRIKGKSYQFLFDTGAITAISEDLAKELQLKAISSMNIQDPAHKSMTKNIYRIDSLQIGNISFLNEGCVGIQFNSINDATCLNIDGIIGANLMKTCYWEINYSDSTLSLYSKRPSISSAYKSISFKESIAGAIPVVELEIADTTIHAFLDYGLNGLSTIPESVFKRIKPNKGAIASGNGSSLITVNQVISNKQYRTYIENIKLDGTSFGPQFFDSRSNSHEIPLIGAAFLKNYKTILDWNKHKIYMAPLYSEQHDVSQYTESFGIKANWENGKTVIGFVWDNTTAQKDGISIGDEVIEVNDYNHLDSHDNFCSLQQDVFSNEKLQKIQITLKDKAQKIRTYTLDKEKLLK